MTSLFSPDTPPGDTGEEMGRNGFLKMEGEPLKCTDPENTMSIREQIIPPHWVDQARTMR